jgi:hypothetical protein
MGSSSEKSNPVGYQKWGNGLNKSRPDAELTCHPSVLIKDRTVDWPVVVETLQLATYPGMGQGKLEPGYSICEETIAHWEWRDGGSSMYPPGIVARLVG